MKLALLATVFLFSLPLVFALHDGGGVIHSENVRVEPNKVILDASLKFQQAASGLVEMQLLGGSCSNPLSYVSPQTTCKGGAGDVHRYFMAGAGDTIQISLDKSISAGKYCVKLVSADTCCTFDPTCQAISPYGWSYRAAEVDVPGSGEAIIPVVQPAGPNPNPLPATSTSPGTASKAYDIITRYGVIIGVVLVVGALFWRFAL